MKTRIINYLGLGLLTLLVTMVMAEVTPDEGRTIASSSEVQKTIVFNYKHNGKPLKLTFKWVFWETALKEGAHKCMDYYTDGKRAQVAEELYLDLIDVCVNPR